MPTTRARAAAATALVEARQLIDLPLDALGLVLYQLPLAHDIAAVAPTCHALCDAAKLASKLRPFSGEVLTLAGHTGMVFGVAVAPDGRVITASSSSIKIWRDGACERSILKAHRFLVSKVSVLPGGAHFVSCSGDGTVKLWTPDGDFERNVVERTSGYAPACLAAMPDGVHFLLSRTTDIDSSAVRLFHVDGTLVHTFVVRGGCNGAWVSAVAATRDGQHVVVGLHRIACVKVWSVATKSLVNDYTWDAPDAGGVTAVAAMPDSKRILSGCEGKTVHVWRLGGALENTFMLHTNSVRALVALPDNQHALSASNDGDVKLFNVNDGAVLRTFWRLHAPSHTCPGITLALTPDGLRFVCSSFNDTARIVYHGLAPH
jgi:WD40 repeat protein